MDNCFASFAVSRLTETVRSQREMYGNCLQLLARLGPTLGSSLHARQIVTTAILASIPRFTRPSFRPPNHPYPLPLASCEFPLPFPYLRLALLLVKRLLRTLSADEIELCPSDPSNHDRSTYSIDCRALCRRERERN